MRAALALWVVLTACGGSAAEAQADLFARLGLTFATPLVRDRVLGDVEVRQSLAPTLALGASLPFTPRYGAGIEATVASSGFHSAEAGTDTDLGTLRTGSILLGLEGPVARRLRWLAGAGFLTYWPADGSGIFLRGGRTRFLAGAGLDYRHPIFPGSELMVSLRYDFHRFTTDELVARGFSGTQGVQRVSASVGLARGPR